MALRSLTASDGLGFAKIPTNSPPPRRGDFEMILLSVRRDVQRKVGANYLIVEIRLRVVRRLPRFEFKSTVLSLECFIYVTHH